MRLRILLVAAGLCALLIAPIFAVPSRAASGDAVQSDSANGDVAPATKAGRKAARLKAQQGGAKTAQAKQGGAKGAKAKAKNDKNKTPDADAQAADPDAPTACPPVCTPKHKAVPPPPPLPAVAGKPSGPQGDNWQSLALLPDFSGSWIYDLHPAQVSADNTEIVPLLPGFAERLAHQRALSRAGSDIPAAAYHCMPRGVPEVMELVTRAYEFLLTPGLVTIVPQNNEARFVYTDGRKPPANVKRSWNGYSVGHWEGAMLVVDTTAIRPGTDMFYGFPGGTEQRVIERFKRISDAKMQSDTTVIDPTALSKPYTFTRTYTRTPFPISEEVCLQNNRDLARAPKQQFDFTPSPANKKPHPAKAKTANKSKTSSAAHAPAKDTP
jgi:hypothetical protein